MVNLTHFLTLDQWDHSGEMRNLSHGGGVLFGYLPTCLGGTDSPCGCLEWLHAIKMNCSSSVFMTWRRCVVRGNIAEMVNRDRCICLLLMGASKATMLMFSSAADSGHLLGGMPLLSTHIGNQSSQINQYVFLSTEKSSCISQWSWV